VPTDPVSDRAAYARAYTTSDQRKDHLPEWTHM